MSARLLGPGGEQRLVEFIQYDIPPLKSGEYTVTATQTVNQPAPNDKFTQTRQFAVAGERFSFDPSEIHGVFPPPLANGEFADVLPHVIFDRNTLPWERTSVSADITAPWLAVLLLDAADALTPVQRTAADLIELNQPITVAGSKTTKGTGALPAKYVSYPGINPLDYGETPADHCMTIDVPVTTFDAITPSVTDLPYLAHIREADTMDGEDTTQATVDNAIVVGNRIGIDGAESHAYLVSLENMGPYLRDAAGNVSPALDGYDFVRLIVYRSWTFTANTMGESLQALLEGLNAPAPGCGRLTTLQVPYAGDRPTPAQVEAASADEAKGELTSGDAEVLVHNALGMGYVPLGHHLRHAGETVSWYRGPLVPFAVTTAVETPIAAADAANRYDPQTGMFDVSYGAAWQLGQLLALQNEAFAITLSNWRRGLQAADVAQAEQELLKELLGQAFESVTGARDLRLGDGPPPVPDSVVDWLARLRLLNGVPFNYLVPHEGMLPPESLRFFHLDKAWMDALLDGAFSIGRATTGEEGRDALHAPGVHALAAEAVHSLRGNPDPDTDHVNVTGEVTGFLMRSQAVSGWPNLNANGYAKADGTNEIKKLRMARLSSDVLLCMFDGVVEMVAIHEPPVQLHHGVEGTPGNFTTTLRQVVGETPGQQYMTDPHGGPPDALVQARADGRTIEVATTATNIENKLNTDFGQGLTVFTSAEFALEMVKGVVKVEFQRSS